MKTDFSNNIGHVYDVGINTISTFGLYHVSLDMRKHVLGVSDKARLKPVSSASETS